MMDQLHPASFVETQECVGPRDIRNQPSRETSGVLLEDKYITETNQVDFNLPFRNSLKYVDMLNVMYGKLNSDQKKIVLSKMTFLSTPDHVENFESGSPDAPVDPAAAAKATGMIVGITLGFILLMVIVVYIFSRMFPARRRPRTISDP
jgi:hypothetical protein